MVGVAIGLKFQTFQGSEDSAWRAQNGRDPGPGEEKLTP